MKAARKAAERRSEYEETHADLDVPAGNADEPDPADGAGGKRVAQRSCGLVHREGVGTLRYREPARYAGEQGVRGDAGGIRLRGGAAGDLRNTKSETNVLVLAEKSSAQADWKITMRNWGAVEQGDANVPQLAAIADGRFAIYYPNGDSAYFAHEANGWQLTNLSFGDTTQVEVTRSGMTFLTLSDNASGSRRRFPVWWRRQWRSSAWIASRGRSRRHAST